MVGLHGVEQLKWQPAQVLFQLIDLPHNGLFEIDVCGRALSLGAVKQNAVLFYREFSH
jgi:hypothetical protein